jgi:hypothetical protein
MANLSEADRDRVWRGIQNYLSQSAGVELTPYSADALRTGVGEVDDWIETNQASFNSSLSEPIASNATATQKTLMFVAVAAMRVSPAFARKLLGEID